MSVSNIKSAIVEAVIGSGVLASNLIAWPNTNFTKPGDGSKWGRFSFLPNAPATSTLGPNGLDYHDGIAQMDLYFPLNKGDKAATDAAQALCNVFTAGARFLYQGTEVVSLRTASHNGGRAEQDSFRVIVTIPYYSHLQR
jgi:hypothetical protein